jgi:hypothetical protein
LLTISTPESRLEKPLGLPDPKSHLTQTIQEAHVHSVSFTVVCRLPISEYPTVVSHDHPRGKGRGPKSLWRERPLPARLKQETRVYESTSPLPTPRPHRAPPVILSLFHFVFTAAAGSSLHCCRSWIDLQPIFGGQPSRLLRLLWSMICGRPYYTAHSRPLESKR